MKQLMRSLLKSQNQIATLPLKRLLMDRGIDEAFKEIWSILQLFAEEMSKTS